MIDRIPNMDGTHKAYVIQHSMPGDQLQPGWYDSEVLNILIPFEVKAREEMDPKVRKQLSIMGGLYNAQPRSKAAAEQVLGRLRTMRSEVRGRPFKYRLVERHCLQVSIIIDGEDL